MITLGDVARRAGVSKMTVSRVINNAASISPETRARVEQAIAELGYVPNALARSLRLKQTKTIALVLTDITNPFFTTIARGVEDTASQRGFNVIYCNTDESASEETEHLNVLAQKQTDGVLLVPACLAPDSVLFLQERRTPVVVLDRRIPHVRVDTVRCDSEGGAYTLVRHLLELGHTRVAVLSGPRTVSTAIDRVAGYRRAMQAAGPGVNEELVIHGEYNQASGYAMAQQALALNPRPTALFAANNFIAVGAYRALRDAGLRVPEDISLVTFDDLPAPLVMEPFLTVASQPAYEMGCKATELLLARLSGEETAEPQEIILPTELIVRRSSGPPPDRLSSISRDRFKLKEN
jgi:LacI family transcriptional regulator